MKELICKTDNFELYALDDKTPHELYEFCGKEISSDKLEFKFAMDYTSIFDTIALDGKDNYFILNIIFECLNELKNRGKNINKNIQNILWYIPILFNSSSYDVEDNDLKFAQLYASLCNSQEKNDIKNKLMNNRIKPYF